MQEFFAGYPSAFRRRTLDKFERVKAAFWLLAHASSAAAQDHEPANPEGRLRSVSVAMVLPGFSGQFDQHVWM
jgi:hypothetical protein